jgi:hypothetical protein
MYVKAHILVINAYNHYKTVYAYYNLRITHNKISSLALVVISISFPD